MEVSELVLVLVIVSVPALVKGKFWPGILIYKVLGAYCQNFVKIRIVQISEHLKSNILLYQIRRAIKIDIEPSITGKKPTKHKIKLGVGNFPVTASETIKTKIKSRGLKDMITSSQKRSPTDIKIYSMQTIFSVKIFNLIVRI